MVDVGALSHLPSAASFQTIYWRFTEMDLRRWLWNDGADGRCVNARVLVLLRISLDMRCIDHFVMCLLACSHVASAASF